MNYPRWPTKGTEMANTEIRVVMLCGDGQSSRIMYNALKESIHIEWVILEGSISRKRFLQRRIKKLGLSKVIGQLFFVVFKKLLSLASSARITQLMRVYELNDEDFPAEIVQKVDSINSDKTIALLRTLNPDAFVVNGTRIISKKVLSSVKAPLLNTHLGITPKFRGVHGGYWALAQGDRENCGVTVHLIDQGIDTGGVLYQATIHPEQSDNFATYPIHQIAAGIPLMINALKDVKHNSIRVTQGVPPSQLWFHPTLFEYLKNRLTKGVQ